MNLARSEPTEISSQLAKIQAEILAKPLRTVEESNERQAFVSGKVAAVETLRQAIGRRYAGCRLDTFTLSDDPTDKNRQQSALAILQAFVDDLKDRIADGSGLFLFGPAGTGKDHLLSAVMIEAATRGFAVSWVNGQDIFGRMRDMISEDGNESRQLERLTAPAVLAISDPVPPIGDASSFQQSTLLRAIDRRYRDCKPTWVTANVASREEGDSRLGVQLMDRLTDGALTIACGWPSYRLQRRWKPS
jgi:DNA replication protein DnaC